MQRVSRVCVREEIFWNIRPNITKNLYFTIKKKNLEILNHMKQKVNIQFLLIFFVALENFQFSLFLKYYRPNWKIGKLYKNTVYQTHFVPHAAWTLSWSIHQLVVISWTLLKKCEPFTLCNVWNQVATAHFRLVMKRNNEHSELKSSTCSKRVGYE